MKTFTSRVKTLTACSALALATACGSTNMGTFPPTNDRVTAVLDAREPDRFDTIQTQRQSAPAPRILDRFVAPRVASETPATDAECSVDDVTLFVGPKGPQGPAGAPGADGKAGATGAPSALVAGPAGPKGPTGPAGIRGETGARGAIGNIEAGLVGDVGVAGPDGEAGLDGRSGAPASMLVGPAGPAGPVGPAGAQGPRGETGPQGPTLVGPVGREGDAGPAGTRGIDGADGAPGARLTGGISGPAGEVGDAGPRGEVGATGATGAVGVVSEWVWYRDFRFDAFQPDLEDGETRKATDIANYLNANPSLKLAISGRDPRGIDEGSQNLRDRRTIVVRDALLKAGVPEESIEMCVFSEDKLNADRQVSVLIRSR